MNKGYGGVLCTPYSSIRSPFKFPWLPIRERFTHTVRHPDTNSDAGTEHWVRNCWNVCVHLLVKDQVP